MGLRRTPGIDCPMSCVADSGVEGVDGTVSIGKDFDEKVSWSQSEALLRDPTLKHEPRAETTTHCRKSSESRC